MLEIVKDLTKLNEFCSAITPQDMEKALDTANSIKELLLSDENLIALSAPQVGVNFRLFCIKFANGDVRTFINPMFKKQEGIHLSRESSPTIPNKEFLKLRNDTVELAFQTPVGKIELNAFEGAVSEVIQQMMDSIDGIPLNVMALEVLPEWEEASEEERQELIDYWVESLKQDKDRLQKEIEEDPEMKEVNDAIRFMVGVQKGEIQFEEDKPATLNREQRRTLAKLTHTPFSEINKMVKNKKK